MAAGSPRPLTNGSRFRWPATSAEPAMAANVAVKADPIDESTSARPSMTNKRLKPSDNPAEPLANATIADSQVDESRPEIDPLDDSNDDESADESVRSVSSMDRLNAALRNNELETEALPQRSLTGLNERLRVDALLARAKKLLEIGQVDQAHDTALQAQDIGDTAQIEYSPDEDRPIDLVRQIEGQLEAIRLKLTPQSDAHRVETAEAPNFDAPVFSDESPAGTASTDSKTSPTESDTGLARIRRDWSTMFRQKKKTGSTEPGSAAKQGVTPSAPLQPPKLKTDAQNRQASRSTERDVGNAVVQANRSVSLGPLDTNDLTDTASVSKEINEDLIAPAANPPELIADADGDEAPNESFRSAPVELMPDPSGSTFDADDTDGAPPDFDAVEPVAISRDRTKAEFTRPRLEVAEDDGQDRQSDWTLFSIGFGLCSILAIGCYRRGAT